MKKKVAENTKGIILLLFSFMFLLLLSANSASALTCAVRAGACNTGETALLRMQAADNSHAGFVGSSSYNNLICCSEGGVTVGASCSGNYDTFLKLSAADNAHVEKKGFLNYASNACVSVNVGSISCSYSAGACPADYVCLARISAGTNTHIGNCGSAYTNSVCCGYTAAGVENCSNGIDDDGDSSVDCADTADCPAGTACAMDANQCTNDICGGGSCAHPNNTDPCNDGNACTSGDICGGGSCSGTAIVACAGSDGCCPAGCANPPDTDCGACVPSCPGGCADVGQADGCGGFCPNNTGNACNDGNACTSGDVCGGGSCSGSAITCNDGNVCTDDSCNPAAGCVFTNNTNPCNDGNACTYGDACDGGGCVKGTSYTCTPTWCQASSVCDGNGGCDVTYFPPSCVSLTPAHQDSIRLGNITLTASTNCATSATIDNGFGAIPVNGDKTVAYNPTAGIFSTTYWMSLSGPGGNAPNACSAIVDLLPQCAIAANPTAVAVGGESDFTWTTTDADPSEGYRIDQGVGDVSAAPQPKTVSYINSPIDFTMTVEGYNPVPHINTCSVHIDELTSCDLISPTTPATPIVAGDTANLTWTSSDATSAVLTPTGVAVAVNGNMNVTPAVTTTYRLDVTGGAGANFCAATVHVIPLVIPSCSLTTSSTTLKIGEATILTWTSTGAIIAGIDYGVGSVTPVSAGEIFFYPTAAGTYPLTMTVTSASSTTAICSTANITVNPAAAVIPLVGVTKRTAAGSIEQIMSNVLAWALPIAGSLLLLMIIIGGALYISSTGEENKITAAKKMINWAVIGAILILAAYVISSIVYRFFGL